MDHSEIVLREKLARAAAILRRFSLLPTPTSPMPKELAELLAGALERFVRREAPTLDKAFGLGPKKGRPRDLRIRRRHIKMVRMIDDLLAEGLGWENDDPDGSIPKALNAAGHHLSVSEMRRLHGEWYPKLRVRRVLQELAADDPRPVPNVKGD